MNLDQKVSVTEDGVKRTYGFAKYLHDSLPGATYVGFTGTPIDATLDVFGPVVDAYTMTESVVDEITVPIVYEGRAAKVLLDNSKLTEIEAYYAECADEGASTYAIEASKKANLQMNSILGDPDRLKSLAADFVDHYEARIEEGSTVAGKAMFVSSSRQNRVRLLSRGDRPATAMGRSQSLCRWSETDRAGAKRHHANGSREYGDDAWQGRS